MNKFKKILNYLKGHKGLFLLVILFLILLIVILIILLEFVKERSSSKYGTRLEGISEIEMTNKQLSNIEKKIKENSGVDKAKLRVQGKIIYVNIKFNKETTLDKAKEIANSNLSDFSDKEIEYYDICYFLTQTDDKNEETKEFASTGTKQPKVENISWIKS